MDAKHCLSLMLLAMCALLAFYSSPTEACMCMPSHPQTHFCQADYVILVRVLRQSPRIVSNKIVYKVEIKKSYKMNPAAQQMLRHGRLITADSESMCGVKLHLGRLYVIAGRSTELNLCNYVKEYMNMTLIERRGFAGVYRKGCTCNIKTCFGQQCLVDRESRTGCKWSPFAKCETDLSACMPLSYYGPEGMVTKCHWRRTPAYKACMSDP